MSHENEEALPEDDISDITVTHPNSVQNVQKVTAELTKAQKNIKSLTDANAKWEVYTNQLKTDHEQELGSVAKDLKNSQQKRKELTALLQDRERQVEELRKSKDVNLEEQKDKAVKLAIQQTTKIDELKLKLHQEKLKVEQAEQKIKYLEKAIENLRKENEQLSRKPVPMDTSASPEPYHKKIKELQDEIIVLQEQLKIFKGDFDIERNDREKAQSEITTLEAEVVKLVEKLKKQEGRMIQKEKEAAALKESNRELQRKYEHLHHKLQKQSKYEGSNYDIHFHGEREERRRRNTPSPVDRQIEGLITESQKRHIRKNWTHFVSYLRLDDVLPRLFSVGMISLMEKEEIESKPTSYNRNEHFLTHCLMRGTQSDIRNFRSALIDTYQKHLADQLPPLVSARPQHREEPMEAPPSQAEASCWQCKDCTFVNNSTNSHCEICKAKRQTPFMETLVGRGVDQCDNTTTGQRVQYPDVEED